MAKLKFLLWALATVLFLVTGASAQTVSIVSGNGQMTCAFFCGSPFFSPLVVVVKDANGAPLPNATVTWTVTSGPGSIAGGQITTQTITDATGQSLVGFFQSAPITTLGFPYLQSTVTATAGSSSVTFTETTALANQQGQLLITPQLISPAVGSVLTGQSGQQGTTPITISVGAPNVELRLVEPDTLNQARNISCVTSAGASPGTVLSDASGVATCTPIFGGQLGTNQFQVALGGSFSVFGPFVTDITAGPPCAIRVLTGNNQSGNAGQNLPTPLLAEVDDCGGNPLTGIPVVWTVTQGAATLFNTRTSTTNGLASTNVTLGSAPGQTVIRVAVAPGTTTSTGQPLSANFTVTTNISITGLQKAAGDVQDAAVNTAFSQPLVVQVNTPAGQPAAGITVQWAVASGSVTLGAATSVTNAQGQASNTVQAGATTGPATVTASIGTFSVTFNLTVRLAGPANVTFVNGAGFQPNFLSPCGIATIRGTGLASGIQGAVVPGLFGPLPLQLANVTVQFGNSFAPIYNVVNSGGQESVTVQVPCEVQAGAVPVTIRVGGGSAQFTAQVQAVAPGMFETAMSDGRRRAVLVKPDGTFVSLENPARRGETIRMYVTGLGPVTPAVPTNSPGIPDTDSFIADLGSIIVGVNNAGVRVVSARYARDLIGVYEVAFVVPNDVPAGSLPLAIAVNQGGSLVFGNGSAIPVQ